MRLLARAERIEEPTWRHRFLHAVPVNARILALADEWRAPFASAPAAAQPGGADAAPPRRTATGSNALAYRFRESVQSFPVRRYNRRVRCRGASLGLLIGLVVAGCGGGTPGGSGGSGGTGANGGTGAGLSGGAGGPGEGGPILRLGTGQELVAVASSGSRQVAIAIGTSLTSAGASPVWRRQSALFDIGSTTTWDGRRFVMLGGRVSTTTDGATFETLAPSLPAGCTNAIAWSGSRYVAVGPGSTICTSTDAVAWTAPTPPVTEWLVSVIWSDGQFVALGMAGTILTSTNGTAWTVRRRPIAGAQFASLASSGTRYVAFGTALTMTSVDLTTWTQRTVFPASFDSAAWSQPLGCSSGSGPAASSRRRPTE